MESLWISYDVHMDFLSAFDWCPMDFLFMSWLLRISLGFLRISFPMDVILVSY
jgi:hypothetical protein